LHDEPGYRCRQPVNGQVFRVGTKGFKNAAGIGILQGESHLDAQKAKTHIPDLQKTEAGFFSHSGSVKRLWLAKVINKV
jgi:hypothetical protein